MGKPATTAKAEAGAVLALAALSVTTKVDGVRVDCAGLHWAGESVVPASSLTATQIEQLKADERLVVKEVELPADAPPAT